VKAAPWDVDRRGFTLTGSVVVSGGLYVFLLRLFILEGEYFGWILGV